MSPHLRGGGHWFWCRSRWRRRDTLSAQYLVNQRLDSYKLFMDIKFGHNKNWMQIRFWWPWPKFQAKATEKLKIYSGGTSLFTENTVTSCFKIRDLDLKATHVRWAGTAWSFRPVSNIKASMNYFQRFRRYSLLKYLTKVNTVMTATAMYFCTGKLCTFVQAS